MKTKKFMLLFTLITVIISGLVVLSSCSLFNKEEVVAPTIESITMLKTTPNYLDSDEYLYNKDSGNPMAIASGGSFLLSIEYNNPKKYSISYVNLNNEKIVPSMFAEGSTKNKTIIKLTVPSNVSDTQITYVINSIYFNTGSATKRIKSSENIPMEYSVRVAPKFKVKLDYQNRDRRASTQKATDDVGRSDNVDFGTEMSTVGVATQNYAVSSGVPTKEGGWIFEGWYTEPNGGGIVVKGTDRFYFWSDITLYAFFTRLFKYEIVELDEPIEHAYSGKDAAGEIVTGTKIFTSGVIITEDDSRGQFPKMDIDDTIVDERAVVNTNGTITVTASEYPVVKVGNKAFKNKNNFTELRIGKYITEIGYSAFDNCNQASKVTINEGSRLKYIGDYAFQDTKSMGITTPFTLPDTVVYLGNFAFNRSGWSNTVYNDKPGNILPIKPTYKYLGAYCFMGTGFSEIIFESGLNFESQIPLKEAQDLVTSLGYTTIRPELNRIGANLFANCKNLTTVRFLSDTNENNALNIIPDRAFDAGSYTVAKIQILMFGEGLTEIGNEAFNYQEKIPELEIPATVELIGRRAFYNCISVLSLKFKPNSQLKVMLTECFARLPLVDRIVITSSVLEKYGNGPFAGCSRLKSVEFPNLNDASSLPSGFHETERPDEVLPQHFYSDLMFGTFETGAVDETGATTYSLPTRVFCKPGVMDTFKDKILEGKVIYIGSDKTPVNTKEYYRNVVFVHDINLIIPFTFTSGSSIEPQTVDIALQEIKDATTNRPIAYSLVYWAARSTNIILPDKIPGYSLPITELAMYSLPTSVVEVTVPSNYTRFEKNALNGCTKLETIKFMDKNTLQYIGDYAFFGTKITSFEAGSGLRVIGENAFMNCRSLQWVDLGNANIKNPFMSGVQNPRKTYLTQYKYEYELKDNKGNRTLDYVDTLYDGAFQNCVSLAWFKMPLVLQQVPTALLSGCHILYTVIIPSTNISSENSPTSDSTFYYRALPMAVYSDDAIRKMTIYVQNSVLTVHESIFPQPHYSITAPPAHP